jgi:hypothetical protein
LGVGGRGGRGVRGGVGGGVRRGVLMKSRVGVGGWGIGRRCVGFHRLG